MSISFYIYFQFLSRRKKRISLLLRYFFPWYLCYDIIYFLNKHKINERRRRDLNPRAGHPTYTLSRGASSASWVLLLNTELNPLPILKWYVFQLNAWFIIHKPLCVVNPLFTFFINHITIRYNSHPRQFLSCYKLLRYEL